MAKDWILVATLPESAPRVLAIGRRSRPMPPLDKQLRGPTREPLIDAVTSAFLSKKQYRRTANGIQVIAEPFLSPLNVVNAVQVWAGRPGEKPPERLPTGAWVWDINKGTCLASPEVHRVYEMPPEKSLTEISRVQSLYGVTTGAEQQGKVLAAAMAGEVGLDIHYTWKIQIYSGALRLLNFAARLTEDNEGRRWLHGVTQDITEGDSAQPDPLTFEASVIEAEFAAAAGAHAALVDTDKLTAVRWLGPPLPSVQCEMTGDAARDPAIHPEDVPTAKELARKVRTSLVEGKIRVRSTDGGWIRLSLVAAMVVLDTSQPVSTALVKVRTDEP